MKDTEIIRCESSDKKCYICNGTGITRTTIDDTHILEEIHMVVCKTCEGTGIFKDNHYIIITKDSKGNKIAFNMDSIK